MVTTLCVSMTGVHIEKKTQAHKEKPSNSIKRDLKNDKAINMSKDDRSSNKQKGEKTSQELIG